MLIVDVVNSKQDTHRWSLDFVNTSEWHASLHPEETLHSYTDLVDWVKGKGILSEEKAQKYLENAIKHPKEADLALQNAIAQREAIYRILVAVINREAIPGVDLAEFNLVLGKATCGANIVATDEGFAWECKLDEDSLESLVWPIILSAAELLVSGDRQRIRQCADEQGCGWLFLDRSKNHSRRWCDMRNCGNRAKQRRHYQKGRVQLAT